MALLTAIGAVVLAVFAVVTAWYARRAFRGQSDQLGILKDQLEDQKALNARQTPVFELQARELQESLDERKREAEEQRRAQASMVFIWEHADTARTAGGVEVPAVTAHAVNTSDQPLYDAELRWHRGSAPYGDPNPEPLPTIMPGDDITRSRLFSGVLTWPSAARSCDSATPQVPRGCAGQTAASPNSNSRAGCGHCAYRYRWRAARGPDGWRATGSLLGIAFATDWALNSPGRRGWRPARPHVLCRVEGGVGHGGPPGWRA